MPDLTIGSLIRGFRVVAGGDVPYLNARYRKLVHEETGATLYHTTRDDGKLLFSVGFRTLPEDNTGVFHILEHSCLDGSERYPLREPFVNLLKTSIASDLNASTYAEKTLYYFSSPSERDFMNLLPVYLDAVFFPLLLRDRRVFEKEAWRLEPTETGGLSCSGVVLNEMQSSASDPDSLLYSEQMRRLFPDLYLAYDSGGDPAEIPSLTYEGFTETYRRFYTTANAMFYLSGRADPDGALSEIDRVLRARGKAPIPAPPPAPPQAPVVSTDGSIRYPLSETEREEGNTRLLLSYVMDTDDAPEDALGIALLSRYLTETTESPLAAAVLRSGVGQDFSMFLGNWTRQPTVNLSLNRSDPDKAEPFRRVVTETLAALARDGLPHDLMRNLIDRHEADCRRASLNAGTGMQIMEDFLRQHALRGEVETRDGVARLRERLGADERYFERLIERYILESRHYALTRCVPSRTVAAEKRRARDEWLAGEAARLHAEEGAYEALEARTRALHEYLSAPEQPGADACIPRLRPADLGEPALFEDIEESAVRAGAAEAPLLACRAETEGIAEAGLVFDVTDADEREIFCLRCLQDALFGLPTASHTVPELTDLRNADFANFSCWLRNANWADRDEGKLYLTVAVNAPEERLERASALLGEYLREASFDRDVLRRIFSNAADRRSDLLWNGSRTAAGLASSAFRLSSVCGDCAGGVRAYRRFADLADRFDDRDADLRRDMAAVLTRVLRGARPTAFVIGSDRARGIWERRVQELPIGGASGPAPACPLALSPREDTALTISDEVSYCAEVLDLTEAGRSYTPRLNVIGQLINSRYFWDEIRAKGGAYGASAGVTRTGLAIFTSYRDPRVSGTYRAYEGVPDYLEGNLPDQDELNALIVGASGPYYAPMGPLQKAQRALWRRLDGFASDRVRAEIAEIRSVTQKDFLDFAAALRELRAGGRTVRAVVGNADAVAQSGLFGRERTSAL